MNEITEIVKVLENLRHGLMFLPLGGALVPAQEAIALVIDLLTETQDIAEALKALRVRGYKAAQTEIDKVYGA